MDNIEKLEAELFKLQNDIEILQKSNCLADSDHKESSRDDKCEVKNNCLKIKQLEKQVGELKIRSKKQQMNDFKLMQEAICQKCKEPTDFKASSPKDMLERVESRVLDLSHKAQSQLHHLKHLERTFNEENDLLKKMNEKCKQDDNSTETECIQKIRHLENVHSKTLKNIEDCEIVKDKMKRMMKNAQKKNISCLNVLAELKKNEQIALADNKEKYDKEFLAELKNEQTAVEESKQKYHEESRECVDAHLDRNKKELERLKNDINVIKDTTCCHDNRDIDSAFLEQKATNKDLIDITKKAEKRLIELKEEKKNLASKRALMKEVDSVYPKSDEDLALATSRFQEQQKRLDTGKDELDRVNSHTNKSKDVFRKLIVKLNPKVNKLEMNKKDVKQLSKQLENVVRYRFPSTEFKVLEKSKNRNSS